MKTPSRKEQYAIFLQSQWWVSLSRLKRELVGSCEKCHTKQHLQCHHIRYPENWFETQIEDLQVLCRDCHKKEHGLKAVSKPKRFNPANFKRKRQNNRHKRERSIGLDHVKRNPLR